MNQAAPAIRTRIWREEAEPDNPFATRAALCHGYDVYGEMLGQAGWAEMLWLLLRGERARANQARALELLAVALANPGPRDPAVHAAMCGGVGGSTAASCLMAALAVGAGQHAGAREVYAAMLLWQQAGTDLMRWPGALAGASDAPEGVWQAQEHAPGFDPHGVSAPTIVCQALDVVAQASGSAGLAWLVVHRIALEEMAKGPLSMAGVAAAAFADLGFSPDQGEMLYLLLRLPGAAAHALEQRQRGHKSFPFFALELEGAAR